MQIYYFFFLSFLINISCFIVLSQSNTNTIILNPKTNAITHAVAYPYQYFPSFALAPNAINIYDGTGNTSCDYTMTIQSFFQLRCKTSLIYLYVAADEQYIAYVGGNIINSSGQQSINYDTFKATNYKCGNFVNFTLIVSNDIYCDNDDLVLIYAFISEDCNSCSNDCRCRKDSLQCGQNCNYCIENSICLGCVNDYVLNKENKCQFCNLTIIGCKNCSSNSSCLSCIDGYALDPQNQCQFCNLTIIGCKNCFSNSSCLSCIDRYYLDQLMKICFSCGIGCLSCRDSFNCLKCNEDFNLNQQKYCQKNRKIQLLNDLIKGIEYYLVKSQNTNSTMKLHKLI